MSKMGNFVLDMQTDAVELGRDQFVNKYGAHNSYIWDQVRFGSYLPDEPDDYYYPASDPQDAL
jgi:hypothetical protein